MKRCHVGAHLAQLLDAAHARHEILEQARLTRELMEHDDKCAVCRGLLPQPKVPLADQLFGTRVIVTKGQTHE